MIEQQGKVVAVSGGQARVQLGGSSGCPSCDAGKGCGAGVFGRLLKRNPVVLELDNEVNAAPGQPVMVGIPETLFVRMVSLLYLLPLLAGLAGAALGYYFSLVMKMGATASDVITLLCAVAGGAAAVFRNRKHSREFPPAFIVHLLRVVEIQKTGK